MTFKHYISDSNPKLEYKSWCWSNGMTAIAESLDGRVVEQRVVFRDFEDRRAMHILSLHYPRNDQYHLKAKLHQTGQVMSTFAYDASAKSHRLLKTDINWQADETFSNTTYTTDGRICSVNTWSPDQCATETVASPPQPGIIRNDHDNGQVQVYTQTTQEGLHGTAAQQIATPGTGGIFLVGDNAWSGRAHTTRFGLYNRNTQSLLMVAFCDGSRMAIHDEAAEKHWRGKIFKP